MTQVLARRPRPTAGLVDRVRWALRSFWTGPLLSSDPAIARLFSDGPPSASGVAVTARNAFTFSAVYDAINQQSSDVAKLPLKLKRRRPDGGTDDYSAAKLYELMTYAPNPETDPMVFRRTLNAHAMTWHGGFAEIERNGLGEPIALWILTPDRVEPFRDRVNGTYGRLQYRIDGSAVLEARDVFHLQGLGYDGTQAYPLITLARQAIGLALAAESFGGTVFRQGRYGGVLATEDDLDPDQQTVVKGDIQKMRQGYEQFLVLFGQKWNYTRTAIASSEAELSKTREQQIEEVARFFNHPLYKLKHPVPGSQSYASNEMADLDYYKGPILNWVTLWEQQLNRKLIAPLERKQQFFKHNVNAFLRGDIKSRYDALGVARDKGIINADEWRELEDMNPQDGGQGKLYLVQLAQVPLNKIEELTTSQIEKNKPAPPPPPSITEQELQDALDRAARADALAAEARAETAAARERLAAVEASGLAATDELTARRSEVEVLSSRTIELEVIAEFVRERSGELQRVIDERAAAVAEITAERDRMLREATDADRDRHSAVLAAHRTLLVDIMRRMVDRETERARRAQTTPEKLRTFLATFYSGHQELCETALLPAVRVHLAYTRSTDDPVAVTRRLVTQHIEESVRQLHAVLDGEADELGVSLGALLRRWESERVEIIPDYLLKRGLDYAARAHS